VIAVPLTRPQLIQYALEGEAVASGSKHADNIAPCLHGGFTLSNPGDLPDVVQLPYPPDLHCVLVHPPLRVDTSAARGILSPQVALKTHTHQSARLAALVAGLCTSQTD
jgi:homoserine kinase